MLHTNIYNTQTRLADKPPQSNYSVAKIKNKRKSTFGLVCKFDPWFFLWKYVYRISSYDFKNHNTHCGQHCQDFITCTCFLSHEPNVSKHSQLSRGMCSQLSLDVLWTSDSRRLLRYKAHKNIGIQRTKFMIWVETKRYNSTLLTITNTKQKRFIFPFLAVWWWLYCTIPPKTYMATMYYANQIEYCYPDTVLLSFYQKYVTKHNKQCQKA